MINQNKRTQFQLLAMLLCLFILPASAGATHRLYVSDNKQTVATEQIFNTVNEALRYAERFTDDADSTLIYIEPSVYWLDNPDDEAVRKPRNGDTPYAMELRLSNTHLIGLGDKADDVVLAVNRGQTQGADGNFTMMHITGSNNSACNITFGNYCNVDLVYQRDETKNRKRRNTAIVQAQIAIVRGDNYTFNNCRFISRLNLCPFIGSPHTDFTDCYFECTDDALAGSATYRHCRFTLFSSKPFYTTDKKIGVRLIDCDIHCKTRGTQYFTKVSGSVTVDSCRFTSDDPSLKIEWAKRAEPENLCVMTNSTLNGKPLIVATPTEPLPIILPPFYVQNQPQIKAGSWTIDCHKPQDTNDYPWQPDTTRAAWAYAEGVDGAENKWGMVQVQRGARLMYTPKTDAAVKQQQCTVTLEPCKGPGQGFGSATGQYLDICIKFDTKTLTGYGMRLIRTPDYDRAVAIYLVEYSNGTVTALTEPQRCDLFKPSCTVTLNADSNALFTATIEHDGATQTLSAIMPHPNTYGGFHLQHTGTTGASATVVRTIRLK